MKNILVLLLAFMSTSLSAQNEKPLLKDSTDRHSRVTAVRWSVLDLTFARYSSLVASFEKGIGEKVSIETELGLTINAQNLANEQNKELFQNKRGVTMAVRLRKFGRNALKRKSSVYLAAEVFFNHTKFDRERAFIIDCGENCAFSQLHQFVTTHNQFGFLFRPGWRITMTDQLFIEVDFGIGFEWYDYKSPGVPTDRERRDFGENPNNYGIFSIAGDAAFRIGWRIK